MFFYSSIEPLYFILPIVGLIVGLFGTMLGGGGGFFFLPLLTIVYGVPTHNAILTALVATLPICLVGSWIHYRKGNVNFKVAKLFLYTGIVGALIGTTTTSFIQSNILKIAFGLYLIIIAINMVLSSKSKQTNSENNPNLPLKQGHKGWYGLLAGMITGAFGTSGTAPVLAGLFSSQIPIKQVIGTSLLIVLVNTVIAIGAHLHFNTIDLTLVSFLTSGSLVGALMGPQLLTKSNIENKENGTKTIYAAVIAAIGLIMIIK